MSRLENWVEPIKDEVAFDYGYINFDNYKKLLKEGDNNAWYDLDELTNEIALQYARDVEEAYIRQEDSF